jgi:hypothetical protein
MIHLGSYHRIRRAARGDHHRLTGRDARLGGTAGMFYDLGPRIE